MERNPCSTRGENRSGGEGGFGSTAAPRGVRWIAASPRGHFLRGAQAFGGGERGGRCRDPGGRRRRQAGRGAGQRKCLPRRRLEVNAEPGGRRKASERGSPGAALGPPTMAHRSASRRSPGEEEGRPSSSRSTSRSTSRSGEARRRRPERAAAAAPKRKKKREAQQLQALQHLESFYEKLPPGLIKEDESKPEDCIPDVPGNESARQFLARAPTKGLWMPLGKEVKVMQCWRCKRYGHRTGDKECPFFIRGNQKLEQFRVAHEDPMYGLIRENQRHEKERRIQQLQRLLEDSTSSSSSSSEEEEEEGSSSSSSSSSTSSGDPGKRKKKRKRKEEKKRRRRKKKRKRKASKSERKKTGAD